MGLQLGGFTDPSVGALTDEMRFQQQQLQRQAEEANAANMAAATHTASVGAANFQYHQQQDAEQRALQAHSDLVARQQQQQGIENQRAQQTFDRASQWHGDEVAHQNAALAQGLQIHSDSLAENERIRNANLAERTTRDNTNAGFRDDSETERMAGGLEKQAHAELEASYRMELQGFDPTPHKAESARLFQHAEELRKQRQPWNEPEPAGPALFNPHFALPSPEEPASSPEFSGDTPTPQTPPPTPDSGVTTAAPGAQPVLTPAAARAAKDKRAGDRAALGQKNFELRNTTENRVAGHQEKVEAAKESSAQNIADNADGLARAYAKAGKNPVDAIDLYTAQNVGLPPDWQQRPALVAESQRLFKLDQDAEKAWNDAHPEAVQLGHTAPMHVENPDASLRRVYKRTPNASPRDQDALRRLQQLRDQYSGAKGDTGPSGEPAGSVDDFLQPNWPQQTAASLPQPPARTPPKKPDVVDQQRWADISAMPIQTPEDRAQHDFAVKMHGSTADLNGAFTSLREANVPSGDWRYQVLNAEQQSRDRLKTPQVLAPKPGTPEPWLKPEPNLRPTTTNKDVDWPYMETHGTPEEQQSMKNQHAAFNNGSKVYETTSQPGMVTPNRIAQRVQKLVEGGWSPDDARKQAQREAAQR